MDLLRWTVVAGIVCLVLLAALLPRPAFQIDRVDFLTTACDPTFHRYQVTASMTIRNAGSVGGVVSVHLLIDTQVAATGQYEVPPRESVQRGLSAIVSGCQWHEFSVQLFVEPSP